MGSNARFSSSLALPAFGAVLRALRDERNQQSKSTAVFLVIVQFVIATVASESRTEIPPPCFDPVAVLPTTKVLAISVSPNCSVTSIAPPSEFAVLLANVHPMIRRWLTPLVPAFANPPPLQPGFPLAKGSQAFSATVQRLMFRLPCH